MLVLLILLLCAYGNVGVTAEDDYWWGQWSYYLKRLNYVERSLYKVLHYRSLYNFDGWEREPLEFDSFGLDDFRGFYHTGSFHVRYPKLYGYTQANCTPHVNFESKEASLHCHMPEANITGEYDQEWSSWKGSPYDPIAYNTTGDGVFFHTFKNVDLIFNFTVVIDEFYKFPVARNVHSRMSIESCKLWAESYAMDGVLWDEEKWATVSRNWCDDFNSNWYKSDYEYSQYFGRRFDLATHSVHDMEFYEEFTEEIALYGFNFFFIGEELDHPWQSLEEKQMSQVWEHLKELFFHSTNMFYPELV